jgi:hypothetical protein
MRTDYTVIILGDGHASEHRAAAQAEGVPMLRIVERGFVGRNQNAAMPNMSVRW